MKQMNRMEVSRLEVGERLVAALCVLSPLAVAPSPIGGMEASKWLLLCGGITMAGFFSLVRVRTSMETPCLLFFSAGVAMVASAIFRDGFSVGIIGSSWYASAVFFWTWTLSRGIAGSIGRSFSLDLLVISALAVAGTAFWDMFAGGSLFKGVASGISGNPNLAAHYSAMAALLLAGYRRGSLFRVLHFFAIGLSVSWVIASGCRAAAVGLALGTFILSAAKLSSPGRFQGGIRVLVVLTVVTGLIFPVLVGFFLNLLIPGGDARLDAGELSTAEILDSLEAAEVRRREVLTGFLFEASGSLDARLCWWSAAAAMIMESPAIGHGSGGFKAMSPLYAANGLVYAGDGPGSRPSSPHSAGLELICSFGLPGFFCLAAGLTILAFSFTSRLEIDPSPAAFLAAWSVCACFSRFWISAPVCSLFGIACLVFFSPIEEESSTVGSWPVECSGLSKKCFAGVAAILMFMFGTAGVFKAWDALAWGTWVKGIQTGMTANPSPGHISRYAEDGRGYLCLGILEVIRGNFGAAAENFEHGLAVAPGDSALWVNRSAVLSGLKRNMEAMTAAASAVRIAPYSPETWSAAGAVLFSAGLFENAILSCRKALIRSPLYLPVASVMAQAEESLGRLDDADRTREWILENAMENPGSADHASVEEAALMLSSRKAKRRDLAGARGTLETAIFLIGPRPGLVRAVSLMGGTVKENRTPERE